MPTSTGGIVNHQQQRHCTTIDLPLVVGRGVGLPLTVQGMGTGLSWVSITAIDAVLPLQEREYGFVFSIMLRGRPEPLTVFTKEHRHFTPVDQYRSALIKALQEYTEEKET
jgi:hypothetical protein